MKVTKKYESRAYNHGNVVAKMFHRKPDTGSSNLKRADRLRRREKLRAAGYIAEDEGILDLVNEAINQEALIDTHYTALHPTKGFRHISLKRLGYGQTKAQGMQHFWEALARAQQHFQTLQQKELDNG